MSKMVFINLPVNDLKRSRIFFEALGFEFKDQFCDDTAICMQISEMSFAMLLTPEKFLSFTAKKIADTSQVTEVLTALSCTSREEVDDLMAKALKNGADEARDPQDLGFMYGRAFEDPDGHTWELFYMDMTAMNENPTP